MKHIFYFTQGMLLWFVMIIFRILPLDAASALGGYIGRTFGPLMGVTKRVRKHLDLAMPGFTDEQKKQITIDMWDNLGRTLAEYPHLEKISRERVTVKNEHIITDLLAGGRGGVFYSAHLGNWEVQVPALLARHGANASLTYRALNNPYADKILRRYRTLGGKIKAYPKERNSGKLLIADLKNKDYLAILIDQKYNEGVQSDFFGKPAMTNPVFVQLAQKYKCPLIPTRCRRLNGAYFEITPHEPLALFEESGAPLPVETVIAQAHVLLENWITDAPGQWLWLHRRWKK